MTTENNQPVDQASAPDNTGPSSDELRIIASYDLVGENVTKFESQCKEELAQWTMAAIVLDLTHVSMLDSRGISVCVGLWRESEKNGKKYSIEASSEVAKLLRLVRLDRVVTLKEVAA